MTTDKSKLMKTAWRIAREAAAKFDGSVKSFFSESLKSAWRIIMETSKKVSWKAKNGQTFIATAELITEKLINADGDKISVKCCEIEVNYTLDGKHITSGRPVVARKNDQGVTHQVNRIIGLTKESYNLVKSAIDTVESHPAWVAKQFEIAKNKADSDKIEKQRIANGYCPKCGSYCCGDCDAN